MYNKRVHFHVSAEITTYYIIFLSDIKGIIIIILLIICDLIVENQLSQRLPLTMLYRTTDIVVSLFSSYRLFVTTNKYGYGTFINSKEIKISSNLGLRKKTYVNLFL